MAHRRAPHRLASAQTPRLAACLFAGVWLLALPTLAGEVPKTPEAVEFQRVLGSIEDRVRLKLESAGGELEGSKIDVRVTPERVVSLEGRVPSADAKAQAGQLALYAVGVSKVENQLQVDERLAPPRPAVGAGRPASDPDISDEDLAKRVARRIADSLPVEAQAKHRLLGGWRVVGEGWSFVVDVEEGKVHLDGRIPKPLEIDVVVASARAIPAVRSVEPSLEVVE